MSEVLTVDEALAMEARFEDMAERRKSPELREVATWWNGYAAGLAAAQRNAPVA